LTNPDDALIPPTIAASAAAANPLGPPPSSETPEAIQEPLGQPGPDDEQPDTQDDAPREFDPRYKDPFNGLLYLGHLEETLTIWGHSFRISTPTQLEKMQVGQIHKPYVGTLASEIAYQTILVAAYLVSVDHQELPRPVTNDPKENAVADRFRWVAENLRPPVIDQLFSKCLVLEGEVGKVLRAMGEAQG
jgi:hypothetical protein